MKSRMSSIWRPKHGVFVKDIAGLRWFALGFWEFSSHHTSAGIGVHPMAVPLASTNFWIQVYDLPIGYIAENIGRMLGNMIGSFLDYDVTNKSSMWRNYMRIREGEVIKREWWTFLKPSNKRPGPVMGNRWLRQVDGGVCVDMPGNRQGEWGGNVSNRPSERYDTGKVEAQYVALVTAPIKSVVNFLVVNNPAFDQSLNEKGGLLGYSLNEE
ncbi:hypothetical protein ACS0TY_029431 [Phlomoides rotata]